MRAPFNFKNWIEENRQFLKPPVGNKCVYKDGTHIVMVVGGPNHRTDFHVNESDEFFYQLEGDIFLRIKNGKGQIEEIIIQEGDVFMLPGGTPHSPQRSEGSVGMVVELTRPEDSNDGLQWYCACCHEKLYEEYFHLKDIEKDFGEVFERYFASEHTKCKSCGHQNGKEWNPK